jgi:alpha-mannosidase
MSGSAIEMVYNDCLQMFTKIDVLGKQMRNDMLTQLLNIPEEDTMRGGIKGLAVINTLPWERNEVIEVPLDDGLPTMKQYSAFGRSGYIIAKNAAASGATGYTLDNSTTADFVPVRVETDRMNNTVMENQFIRVTFDQSGHLIHLWDKVVERELIKSGERGNVFKMYDDIPLFWDAWDVEMYHLEKFKVVEEGSIQILEQGPLRCSLLVEKRLSETSRLRQIVILSAVSRRLDFETEVDWNENRQFLKVEFTWDILADHVNYECQYGHISRPTHYNTSWESAKFEVVAQKFADMSEYGYGVALLNDCKYGYSAHRNVLRLSLLRAPKAPDSNCDVGHHSFKYAIYPHEHHFSHSDVVREGYNFNSPLLTRFV